jgi:hypothetical protein
LHDVLPLWVDNSFIRLKCNSDANGWGGGSHRFDLWGAVVAFPL